MSWALYSVGAWIVFAALWTVGKVGKERKPITPEDAVGTLIVWLSVATVVILAGWRMS